MSGGAERLVFRVHALQRMFERGISVDDVRQVLAIGETIEDYPEDTPFPSRLVLGWRESRPLHVVFADNRLEQEIIVVTVYEPDPARWDPDFRRRQP
jgi:hypothetical protein